MTLTPLDWLVIAAYFALNLAIGLYYARRARGSTNEFFLSGRDVPWWLVESATVSPRRPVVAGGGVDGRAHLRRRRAAGRHRDGGEERHRRQLAVVEHGGERHA